MIHWALGGESVHLVNENSERLIGEFMKMLAEKKEATVADILKWHPYPPGFQMLPRDVKK